ncbi:alpha/beta hydrolase [Chryseobacterium sp. PMSZPI]|uniref:alpha/beta hydrolase n=1 Tax=Chryseobacterium sp. PMSZPI TaxID=1033900 RepID=UPI0039A05A13
MIKENSGYLQSNNIENIKTHQIYYTLFTPEIAAKGAILILHGLQEDSECYISFARHLAFQGFVVLTYDHLGYGKTAKNKDQIGFFTRKNAKEQLIYDAKLMAEFLDNSYQDIPLFIMGHSIGSFITRCLLRQSSIHFNGAVIIGTGAKPVGVSFITTFLYFLDAIAPRYRSPLINRIFLKFNKKTVENDSIIYQRIFQHKIYDTPFTNNVFYTFFSLVETATERQWTKSISKQFPFLFVNDNPTNAFNAIQPTIDDLKSNGFKNVESVFYPDVQDKTPNKTKKKLFFDNISSWLNKVFEELPIEHF